MQIYPTKLEIYLIINVLNWASKNIVLSPAKAAILRKRRVLVNLNALKCAKVYRLTNCMEL